MFAESGPKFKPLPALGFLPSLVAFSSPCSSSRHKPCPPHLVSPKAGALLSKPREAHTGRKRLPALNGTPGSPAFCQPLLDLAFCIMHEARHLLSSCGSLSFPNGSSPKSKLVSARRGLWIRLEGGVRGWGLEWGPWVKGRQMAGTYLLPEPQHPSHLHWSWTTANTMGILEGQSFLPREKGAISNLQASSLSLEDLFLAPAPPSPPLLLLDFLTLLCRRGKKTRSQGGGTIASHVTPQGSRTTWVIFFCFQNGSEC